MANKVDFPARIVPCPHLEDKPYGVANIVGFCVLQKCTDKEVV